ncbi:MAG: metallophosphoesterase [Austwickia sp.]|jgi:predicted MPP superfamily phosphohydrolase|nr:MAG: metallophosphoesterase [Austwickia sp.]
MKTITKSALTLVGTAVGGLAYAGLVERNAFVLRELAAPVLPRGSRPLRILQVADVHLMPSQQRKVAWIKELARLRPDAVINTGDNISHPNAVAPLLEAMSPFLDLPGAFVMGSNDYYAPTMKNPARYLWRNSEHPDGPRLPTEALIAGLASQGWLNLNNARAPLSVGGLELELIGVDDPHIQLDRYDAVAGPADPSADLTVGVVHAPYQRVLDAMTRDGAGLVIAGHTHGGQVALPALGALVTNCDLDRGRAKGVSRWWPGAAGAPDAQAPADAAWLHVSAGLGTSPYAPVRFACRPEATLLTLTPRDR